MSDVRILDLGSAPARVSRGAVLRPIATSDRDALARLYIDSYPPGVAASGIADAEREMDATFADEFGVLRRDASLVAMSDGPAPVGAILVVTRSIWDTDLPGPFVIDLFVDPRARRRGIGAALVAGAAEVCRASGDGTLSLRVGEGTSPEAHALYARLGFVDPEG